MVVGQGTSASVVKIEDQGGLPKDLDTAEPLGESSLKKKKINGKRRWLSKWNLGSHLGLELRAGGSRGLRK